MLPGFSLISRTIWEKKFSNTENIPHCRIGIFNGVKKEIFVNMNKFTIKKLLLFLAFIASLDTKSYQIFLDQSHIKFFPALSV